MGRKNEMGSFAEKKIAVNFDAEFSEPLNLADKAYGIYDDAVAEDAIFLLSQDSRGNKMQNIFFSTDVDSMAGVVATLSPNNNIGLFGEDIVNFAFAFVAPLGADEN